MTTRILSLLLAIALSSGALAEKPRPVPPVSAAAAAEADAQATGGNPTAIVEARDRLQAPGTFIGNATPTAECYYVDTWGGSVPGAGLSRGKSKLDADCVKRKNAELLIAAGYPRLAALVLAGHELTAADIPAEAAETPTVAPAAPTCEERVERAVAACAKRE